MQALSQNIEAKVHFGWPTDPQSDDAICGCVDDDGGPATLMRISV